MAASLSLYVSAPSHPHSQFLRCSNHDLVPAGWTCRGWKNSILLHGSYCCGSRIRGWQVLEHSTLKVQSVSQVNVLLTCLVWLGNPRLSSTLTQKRSSAHPGRWLTGCLWVDNHTLYGGFMREITLPQPDNCFLGG